MRRRRSAESRLRWTKLDEEGRAKPLILFQKDSRQFQELQDCGGDYLLQSLFPRHTRCAGACVPRFDVFAPDALAFGPVGRSSVIAVYPLAPASVRRIRPVIFVKSRSVFQFRFVGI